MNKFYKYESLLSRLSLDSYDKLIEHQELILQGYKFHFIIDPVLIRNYCFPNGIDTDEDRVATQGVSPAYLADEQVILHYLFYVTSPFTLLIVLTEYIPEIRGMIFKAKSVIELQQHFGAYNLDFLEDSNAYNPQKYSLIERVKNQYSIEIAKVLVRKNSLQKFSNLFREEKITYESSDIQNEFVEKMLDTIAVNPSNVGLILEEFKKVISNSQYYLDRETAKERDSSAIDKVISINSYIQKFGSEEEKKNIFLLIGDSDTNKEVFDILKNESKLSYPTINNLKTSFYASTSEYFAYVINSNKDKQITLNNLKELRKTYLQLSDRFYKATPENNNNTEFSFELQTIQRNHPEIFLNYRKIRNAYENLGLLQNHSFIYRSIRSDIETMHLSEVNNFFNTIKNDERNLLQDLVEQRTKMLNELIAEADVNFHFITGINELHKLGHFTINRGVDIIQGTYQQIPLFFRFSCFSSDVKSDFFKITSVIIREDVLTAPELLKELQPIFDRLSTAKPQSSDSLQENIIKAFLLLILPMPELKATINERLFYWLQDINRAIPNKHILKSEVLYFLCWQARRIGKFKYAMEYASEGMKRFKSDPRFYHGQFLAEYCVYEQTKDIGDLIAMLEYLEFAQKNYFNFITEYYPTQEIAEIYQKIDILICNDFLYVYTELAMLCKNDLQRASKYLANAKRQFKRLIADGGLKESLPEYLDSCAYFYYADAMILEDDKVTKLTLAINSLEQAILILTSKHNSDNQIILEYNQTKERYEKELSLLKQASA